jgi:hypothetical protein
VLVWNGRITNAAPAKGEELAAGSPAAKRTAGGGDAIEVRTAQRPALVVQRSALVPSVEKPRST